MNHIQNTSSGRQLVTSISVGAKSPSTMLECQPLVRSYLDSIQCIYKKIKTLALNITVIVNTNILQWPQEHPINHIATG